jgi:hypothetical protein
MPQPPPDRVQREIEELLDQLDNFVPEERLVSKIKNRRRAQREPNALERAWSGVKKRFGRITLGHVMLLGVALLLLASFVPGLFFGFDQLAFFTGIVLAGGAFVLSVLGWDSRRTISGGQPDRRWRGQPIDYSEPSGTGKLRDWLRRRRR